MSKQELVSKTSETDIETASQSDRTRDMTTHEASRYLIPPVDIYETSEGLTVIVDLPAVRKEDISLSIEEGVLTIRGRVSRTVSECPLYREFALLDFHRQFRLSNDFDQERISAELRHGVLTIRLPKSESAKPRQIEVRVRE